MLRANQKLDGFIPSVEGALPTDKPVMNFSGVKPGKLFDGMRVAQKYRPSEQSGTSEVFP
ncbi:hypothetical protein [Zavarzinella formosa]|uniref:hypothetical protein n=1 Tax=Zavarzinella formosa TaxID=360055 RepID=UPI0002ED8035|nr:hypothetical protein [Zavarzinella formosa]